jgi:hypothetical protein
VVDRVHLVDVDVDAGLAVDDRASSSQLSHSLVIDVDELLGALVALSLSAPWSSPKL